MKRCVIAIIFNNDRSQILAIKRRDVPVWVLPGGGIDDGEQPDDAVIREALEETGLQVVIKRKTGEYTPLNKLAQYTHVYECQVVGGVAGTGDETREIGFYPLGALPEPFFFVHEDWVKDALEDQRGIIRKPISQVTYWALLRNFCQHPLLVLRYAMSRLGFPINSKE